MLTVCSSVFQGFQLLRVADLSGIRSFGSLQIGIQTILDIQSPIKFLLTNLELATRSGGFWAPGLAQDINVTIVFPRNVVFREIEPNAFEK